MGDGPRPDTTDEDARCDQRLPRPPHGRPRRPAAEHREDVLRRLHAAGLSAEALRQLFPTWDALIDTVAAPSPTIDLAVPATVTG